LSETPWRLDRRAPRLGEHNSDVFCGLLGLSISELDGLRVRGVVA
jgi:crotonobetainyl-CoA:carnitine CoA-transferase CaiB-like acyl-CoA transferase